MKLTDLLGCLSFYETKVPLDSIEVAAIAIDSRKVEKGSLFVCLKGFAADGHAYAGEAAENGAAAIIAQKPIETELPLIIVPDTGRALAMLSAAFYQNPTAELPLIGVTGTNGKTTVTYLLEKIFQENRKKTGVLGTIQMKIRSDVYPVANTTPDALFLQKSFRSMLDAGVEQAVMEVSSHALDLGRVYGCDFDIAVFTNLSRDHLDYHEDMKEYLHAKSLLFSQLGNTYEDSSKKFAVLNADDPAGQYLIKKTSQQVITYGLQETALVRAEETRMTQDGSSFRLVTPAGAVPVSTKLVGKFNIYNMLAASAAALAAGVSLEVIKTALKGMTGVNGRFEPVAKGQPYQVLVDYAHTPDSLENVLQTILEFATGNVYVVAGCGGDRDRSKRPLMAAMAVKYADFAIFTSDNPRTEDPQHILNDMTKGLSETNYQTVADRKTAIRMAIDLAEEDDVVLIAGKGHETYQQIGDEKVEFDDRQTAAEAIKEKEK
ncbi:UDP-N-acetylmuramoyl-L-alanyl-D-glutamate--2,6-diaminopimelate ligase [Lentibacillus sediminis]|uniref:UDP-N-acetylmuramoyl-L-alanyl-D-glutamate--2, 6-diaminopimelate ligase n=1 Tax=Lentibacillus sediminis TaxID=1940529 RepID=UPI000C1C12EA|nr:UDP-N-acetylmuramoyl-L-alanyl-D-glutamate--2,6-diaminopimelate ligase [Lentibacillus sediminis]